MKIIWTKILKFLNFLILKNFSRNFTSWSQSRGNFISLFILDLDFEVFSFHFSFSISISRHFHFTFHSRNEWNWFSFHFSLLEMSEPDFHFTFHFSKWVNQISISLFTSRTSNIHSRRTLPLLVKILWKRIIFWKFNQREWR